jgi:hypothetical protein
LQCAYLLMQDFDEQVLQFLQVQLPGAMVAWHEHQPDMLQVVHSAKDISLSIMLHYLKESRDTHFVKMAMIPGRQTYKLVQLWEDQWSYHSEKVRSRLLSALGLSARLHARETKVKSMSNNELLDFLNENHLNVPLKAKYKYALFQGQEPVAAISFSKPRLMERAGVTYKSYELLRFCNKLNHTVVGGFTKLLTHFIKIAMPDDIMTYVDRDWSDGRLYEKIGFECVGTIDPMGFLFDPVSGTRYPYSLKDRSESGDAFEKTDNSTSGRIMVYNSGSYKYLWKLK